MATDPFSCPSIQPNSGQSEQWAWRWWRWGDRCQKSPGQEGALLKSRIPPPPAPQCPAHPTRPQQLFTDRASHRETQNCWELGEVRLTWRKCPGIDSWCQTATVYLVLGVGHPGGEQAGKGTKGVSQDPHPPGQENSDRVDRQVCPGPCPHKLWPPGAHQGISVWVCSARSEEGLCPAQPLCSGFALGPHRALVITTPRSSVLTPNCRASGRSPSALQPPPK